MIQGEQSLLLEVSLPHPYEFFFSKGWKWFEILAYIKSFFID